MPKASKLFSGVHAAEPSEAPMAAPAPLPPSREGKRTIVLRMDPAPFQQLRHFSFTTERPVQQLAMEAFDLLFEKYGLPLRARPVES